MIRLFILIGVVGVAGITYLSTFGVGPEFQLPPAKSQLEVFREEGFIADANAITENERVEELGIFELAPGDEAELEKAIEAMGNMDMGGMNMDQGGGDMANMNMDQGGGDMANMNMDQGGGDMANMNMDQGGGDMANMNMDQSGGDMANMNMDQSGGAMAGMDMGNAVEEEGAEGGLRFSEEGAFDREINLSMAEWRFSDMNIDVKKGEKIRFNITNEGKIPHEFMFMSMPLMAAVEYRSTRADWSLYEHEALYEKSLVLPGGKFSFVAEIEEPGVWMFMCMLPYHMQMGMMGQMATDGMSMEM